jgi:hypothetical protein
MHYTLPLPLHKVNEKLYFSHFPLLADLHTFQARRKHEWKAWRMREWKDPILPTFQSRIHIPSIRFLLFAAI